MAKTKNDIIYQDDSLIVINKPSGVSVTKDRCGADDIVKLLKSDFADDELRLIHRIDKLTSGVMILAKTPEAQSRVAAMFTRQQVKRTYLAIVNGAVIQNRGRIKAPLGHDSRNAKLMRVDSRKGTPAITDWRLLADFGPAALLAVSPMTERTHQIRVHCASQSMPLMIDPLYGGTRPILLSDFKPNYSRKKEQTEKPLMDRLTLHAYQLELPMEDGQTKVFIAPLDKKFAATIKMLAKHNVKGKEAFLDQQDLENILKAEPIQR